MGQLEVVLATTEVESVLVVDIPEEESLSTLHMAV